MAKNIVLQCDLCGEWDSKENPVHTVGVAGPKFDLCATHRAEVISRMGVDLAKARAYVEAIDSKEPGRGNRVTLDGKRVRERLAQLDTEATPEGDHQGNGHDDGPEDIRAVASEDDTGDAVLSLVGGATTAEDGSEEPGDPDPEVSRPRRSRR